MDNINPQSSPGCLGRQREWGMFGNWVRNTSTNKNKPPAGLSWLQTGHRDVHTVLSQSHKPLWIEAAAASPCDLPRTSHRDHLSLKKKKTVNPSSKHYIPQNPRHPSCSFQTGIPDSKVFFFCPQLISYPRERVRQEASTSCCFLVIGDAPSNFG